MKENYETIKKELEKRYKGETFTLKEVEMLIDEYYDLDDISYFNKDKKLTLLQAKINNLTYDLSLGLYHENYEAIIFDADNVDKFKEQYLKLIADFLNENCIKRQYEIKLDVKNYEIDFIKEMDDFQSIVINKHYNLHNLANTFISQVKELIGPDIKIYPLEIKRKNIEDSYITRFYILIKSYIICSDKYTILLQLGTTE